MSKLWVMACMVISLNMVLIGIRPEAYSIEWWAFVIGIGIIGFVAGETLGVDKTGSHR